ncbi:hypothetical protein [Bacillus cereus]|uniref:hypothetical protein n=1 Tax=Bacillus cereus TaxID=1396 RepID=UPI0011A4D86D|nr:hypothetical protein [Bacillus cereus]
METIYPRKVTVKLIGENDEIISEATQKTWLTMSQVSQELRIEIEENDNLRKTVRRVEII